MNTKLQDLIERHLGSILIAFAIVIASFLYCQSHRYTHVQGLMILDHWTGSIVKESAKPKSVSPEEFWKTHPRSQLPPGFEVETASKFDPSKPYDIENGDGTTTHVDPKK